MVLVADKDFNPDNFIDIASMRWEETEKLVSRGFYFINGRDIDTPDNTRTNNRPRQTLFQTATVEVTPEQAEVLAVAKEVGLLHLSLRSGADDQPVN